LEPLSLGINAVAGLVYFIARQNDKATEQFQKTLEMDPDFQLALLYSAGPHISKKRYEDALAALEKAMQLPGGMIYAVGYLGMTYALAGQKEKALKMLDQVNELLDNGYAILLPKAYIYMGLGEKDRAFEFLEKAFIEKESQFILFKTMPFLDPLRGDPRHTDLLKKIKLE
jgi:Tfp pilus assembly protein PilF